MCGIVGIFGQNDVNLELYDALTMLQHRGQDAAGITTTCNDGFFHQRKANGLVKDVFRTRHMQQLKGNLGIGHVRYPTAGSSGPALAQPFYVNSPYGICMAHNGNLTNSEKLRKPIFDDLRHVNTDSDSELLLNVFAHSLQLQGKLKPQADDIFGAVELVHNRCEGAYAVVGLIANYGLFAFRDPFGIRPLVYGKRESEAGTAYMIASESVALDTAGYTLVRDVRPGEALFIDMDGNLHTKQCAENPQLVPCVFEHVYFSRPDSMLDDISVYKCRLRMGEKLAEKIQRDMPDHDFDVVIPIPDTSRVASQTLAWNLGLKLREGFMKNRYIGRTFIMPGQTQRKKSVRQKLNPNKLEFQGKNVLLVDDSIVRGTTSGEIIQMARDAGAKKVYMASASPAVRFPNVYGIDMPSADELIAHGRNDAEICEIIGADGLIYQDLDDLIESVREGNSEVQQLDCSVFNGEYVTGDVNEEYLHELKAARNDNAKQGGGSLADVEHSTDSMGLHNNTEEAV